MKRWVGIVLAVLLVVAPACGIGRSEDDRGATIRAGARGDWFSRSCRSPIRHLELIRRGYFPGRSPDVTMTPQKPNLFADRGTTHSGPWGYLQDIPLVFFGPSQVPDRGSVKLDKKATLADIAPTMAKLIGASFPDDRAGRVIEEALQPLAEPPKLVVVVVWDGGGWNVLDRWPRSWPFLRSLMDRGTSISNAVVGSSPSVTPAVHASIGTGAFPDQHGIVDMFVRLGRVTAGAYPNDNPRNLRLTTLGDLYDKEVANRAKVGLVAGSGWHLGMIGHGSQTSGGDKDIAILDGNPKSVRRFYQAPRYLHNVPGIKKDIRTGDLADGKRDRRWLGHDVLYDPEKQSRGPVRTLYQTRQLKALISREGYGRDEVTDLLFTNYKQIDVVGHVFNMVNREMKSILEVTDRTLKDFVRFLNDKVGRGEWTMVLTADHGQGPATPTTGGWPIDANRLKSHVATKLRRAPKKLFARRRPTGYWIKPTVKNVKWTARAISDVLVAYRVRDAAGKEGVPRYYKGRRRDRIFESAFPTAKIDEVIECARDRARKGGVTDATPPLPEPEGS